MSNPFAGATLVAAPIGVINKNGFKLEVNTPPAMKTWRAGQLEATHSLPPYAKRKVWEVNSLPTLPESMLRSDELVGSYVFGLTPNTGLWLDLTYNSSHTHEVAALVSIQGVNALTGEKTDNFELKRFPEKKPAQNYLSTNSGATFWLDGFVSGDGVTRQFVFTEDVLRGVAANLLGQGRAHSIGVAFFKSRQPKPEPVFRGSPREFGLECLFAEGNDRSIEIAAGARIHQGVGRDTSSPDFWEPNPSAVIVLNYLPEELLARYTGAANVQPNEGFLNGIPVGNP